MLHSWYFIYVYRGKICFLIHEAGKAHVTFQPKEPHLQHSHVKQRDSLISDWKISPLICFFFCFCFLKEQGCDSLSPTPTLSWAALSHGDRSWKEQQGEEQAGLSPSNQGSSLTLFQLASHPHTTLWHMLLIIWELK